MTVVHAIGDEKAPCGEELRNGLQQNWVKRSTFGVGDAGRWRVWCSDCRRLVAQAAAARSGR